MAHLPNEVHRLFAQQHGVVGTTQLLEFLTSDQVERFEQQHDRRIPRGVYRSPSWPIDELSRCAAVCLGRPYVAIAGPTAGRFWGFRRLPDDQRIHVVAPPGRKPVARPGSSRIAPRRSVSATSSTGRMEFASLAGREPPSICAVRYSRRPALDHRAGDARRQSDEDEMVSVAIDFVSTKRPWLDTYLRQFARRAPGAPAESHPEVRVFTALVAAGIGGLVRQFPISLPGVGNVRFDLAVPDFVGRSKLMSTPATSRRWAS